MTVKLNQYWTVLPGKIEDYNKFILKKFIPGVNQLGLHTMAVWSVLVGAYSEIMFESVVFPNPGGPCKRTWSSDSPLIFAASTKILRFSTILIASS